MTLGLLIGVVLPLGVLVRWRHDARLRRTLGPYVWVLLVQILLEGILTSVFFLSLAFVSGTLFSGFRLWQLEHARRALRVSRGDRSARRAGRAVVFAGLAFWAPNFLLVAFLLVRTAAA